MHITVIMPVYNAADFLEKSILSVLKQREVNELIIVDDASQDKSLEIAHSLEKKDIRIKVYQHPDKKNHGAGASRNLGIKKATGDLIAFLDADDFYLDNRFKYALQLFQDHKNIDGVYEAIGTHFYNEAGKKAYQESGNNLLTTMTQPIDPTQLFHHLILGDKGYFSIDGLVVKKELIIACGLFNEQLRQAQDTDLILKMCLQGKLVPGNIKQAVAMRGVHYNRIFDSVEGNKSKHQFHDLWFKKTLENNWSSEVNRTILKRKLYYHPLIQKYANNRFIRVPLKLVFLILIILKHPKLLTKLF